MHDQHWKDIEKLPELEQSRKGQDTHRSFSLLLCLLSQKEQRSSAGLWGITLAEDKVSSMEKHLFISLIS